jgi:hypothetical protein
MKNSDIKQELRRRADYYLRQSYLVVHYYRVRRRIAYPLPIDRVYDLTFPVSAYSPPVYNWKTWLALELEERISSLGWAGHEFKDVAARKAVIRDLAGLTRWSKTDCLEFLKINRKPPSLCLPLAHICRILVTAYKRWPWIGRKLKNEVKNMLKRMVEVSLPIFDQHYGAFYSKEEIFSQTDKHSILLQNIPIVGTIGIALAAQVLEDPVAEILNERLKMIVETLFDVRQTGFSEGVSYDGYVLDFMADWVQILPEKDQRKILSHPQIRRCFDESLMLSAPGALLEVAPLSDVEANEWHFHASAHAKICHLKPSAELRWYLNQCKVERFRANGLAALYSLPDSLKSTTPKSGALDAHYATVLRTGWKSDDVAVAMASSNSQMNHIHRDNGSIVIGTQGQWLLTDPGYQQYMVNSERAFTVGPTSHNAPVINGQAQIMKAPKRLSLKEHRNELYTELDITQCYSEELKLKSVRRALWLAKKNTIVICDQVKGNSIKEIKYHWHGHPDAAWWVGGGWARIHLNGKTLWITSPQAVISDSKVDRLKGSRGQLTLSSTVDIKSPTIWWIFSFGNKPPRIGKGRSENSICISGISFSI